MRGVIQETASNTRMATREKKPESAKAEEDGDFIVEKSSEGVRSGGNGEVGPTTKSCRFIRITVLHWA
jgi:hypothetical protein